MLLHDCIVSAYSEGFSGIYVHCKDPHKISNEFLSLFESAYYQAMDDLEEEMDCVCMEKADDIPCPTTIAKIDDDKFLIRLAPLFLSMNDGARADNDYLTGALENVLGKLSKSYLDLSYAGLIAYEWYDEHCGDVVSYEINSDKNADFDSITYPFVEDVFAEIFADEVLAEEFWEKFEDNLYMCEPEDAEEILECFITYNQPQEIVEKVKEILDECEFDND